MKRRIRVRSSSNRRLCRPRVQHTRLRLETLEERRLLAFNVIDADPANLIVQAEPLMADELILEDDVVSGKMKLRNVSGTSSVTFDNPATSLTIELGDGIAGLLGTGDDRLTLTTFDAGFSAALIVQGGAGADSVVVESDIVFPGKDIDVAASSATLTVAQDVVISSRDIAEGADPTSAPSLGDSGAIFLAAPSITMGDNVQLLAHVEYGSAHTPGSIAITANDTSMVPSVLDEFPPILESQFDIRSAHISIANNVNIMGADIDLMATAWDPLMCDDEPALFDGYDIGPLNDLLEVDLTLPAAVVLKDASAVIEIGSQSTIVGSGSVTVEAESRVDATVNVNSGPLDALGVPVARVFSIAYSDANSTARADIGDGVQITADQDVTIRSNADNKASATANTARNLGTAAPADPDALAFALAIADSHTVSHAILSEGATINAGHNVNIHATGTSENETEAETGTYEDGLLGVAIGLGFPVADIQSDIAGQIIAEGSDIFREFTPSAHVNDSFDVISFDSDHGFEHGQQVIYRNGGGENLGGLEDGESYFISRLNDLSVQLVNDVPIDLGTSCGGQHSLTRLNHVQFDAITDVDEANDVIAFAVPHGLDPAQEVVFTSGVGQSVEGLTDTNSYFVIVDSPTRLKLALSADDALAGIAVDVALPSAPSVYLDSSSTTASFHPFDEVDGENDTILFSSAHGLANGEVVVYQDGERNRVGGLVDGESYFVIVDNPTSVRLASSPEAAHDGDADVDLDAFDAPTTINLLIFEESPLTFDPTTLVNDAVDTISFLTPHGFSTGDPVSYLAGTPSPNDVAPVSGLEDTKTYSVVVVDDNTIQLTNSKSQALASVAVDLNPANVTGMHSLHPLQTSGIGIRAELELPNGENSNSASASSGSRDEPTVVDALLSGEVAAGLIKRISERSTKEAKDEGTDFSITAALAWIDAEKDVHARVAGTAELKSRRDIEVESVLTDKVQTSAESTVGMLDEKEKDKTIAAAVTVGLYDNTSRATIDAGATVDASGTLGVDSEISYPYLTEPELRNIITQEDLSSAEGLGDVLGGDLGVPGKFLNSFARSLAQGGGLAIAGSGGYLSFTNTSEAIVGAQGDINAVTNINQDPRYWNAAQTVLLDAKTTMQMIHLTGIFALELSIEGVLGIFYKDNPLTHKDPGSRSDLSSVFNPVGSESHKGGAGASVLLTYLDNTTFTGILDGSQVHTGIFGSLNVGANETIVAIGIAQSGAKAGTSGVSGSVAFTKHESTTLAQIDSGVIVTGGPVSMNALDDTTHTSLLGGVMLGKSIGIGVSLGKHEITRDTAALFASLDTSAANPVPNPLDVSGGVTIHAESAGTATIFAMAAAVVTEPTPDDQKNKKETSDVTAGGPQAGDTGKQGSYGVGSSGAVAIQTVTDNTRSMINDSGHFHSDALNLSASNNTNVVSVTGAIACANTGNQSKATACFTKGKNRKSKSSLGIAGAYSEVNVDGATEAYIADASLDISGPLLLKSDRQGDLFSLAAGGAGAPQEEGIAVAGSVAIDAINNSTVADLRNVSGSVGGDVMVSAHDESPMLTIAGGLAFGGRLGFGSALAVNDISNTTGATLEGNLTHDGNLVVSATNASDIRSITASVGLSSNQQGLGAVSGTVAINRINNITSTSLDRFDNTGNPNVNGSIAVVAADDSGIHAIAGAVAGARRAGLGAAVAYNETANNVGAFIASSDISTPSDLLISANSRSQIKSITASGGIGQDATLAASVSVNKIADTLDAHIGANSNIAAGRIELLTGDGFGGAFNPKTAVTGDLIDVGFSHGLSTGQSIVYSSGGGQRLGGLENGATYFAIADVSNPTRLRLAATKEDAANGIAIAMNASVADGTAHSLAQSRIAALAGSISASQRAVAGAAVATNNISNTFTTSIDDSGVTASTGGINLSSTSNSTIDSFTVGVAGATSFAFGGSVSKNVIASSLHAQIVNGADVIAIGPIQVNASDSSTIHAIAGGVFIATQSTAIGAAVAANEIAGQTVALIGPSTVQSTTAGINVTADSSSTINVITAGGSGAQSFAAGGSVSLNDIHPIVSASALGGSTLTADQSIDISSDRNATIAALAGNVVGAGTGAIGAARATNDIYGRMEAVVEADRVESIGDAVHVSAASTSSINSISAGLTGAGNTEISGGVSLNKIANVIDAHISRPLVTGQDQVKAARDILIAAGDSSTIQSLAGRAAGAGTASFGVAGAFNDISNRIWASAVNSQLNSMIGSIAFDAHSDAKIDTISASGSAAGTASVAGSVASNTMENNVQAYLRATTANANESVVVIAESGNRVNTFGGAIQIGGTLAGGGTVAVTNLANTTQAYINGGSDVSVTGNATSLVARTDGVDATRSIRGVAVMATSTEDVNILTGNGSAGGTAAVAANVSVQTAEDLTEAFIDGSSINANNSKAHTDQGVYVEALHSIDVDVKAGGLAIGGTGGIGATHDKSIITNTTRASIDNSTVQAVSTIDVSSTTIERINSITISGSAAGTLSIAGNVVVVNVDNLNEAYISDSGVTSTGDINVVAQDDVLLGIRENSDRTGVLIGALSIGAAAGGVGGAVGVNSIGNSTTARITDSHVDASGTLDVSANSTEEIVTFAISGGLGAYVGAAGAVTVNTIETDTMARIDEVAGLTAINQNPLFAAPTQNVKVMANEQAHIEASSGSVAVGAGAFGAAIDVSTMKNSVTATIGDNVQVSAEGEIVVDAFSDKFVDSQVVGAAAGGIGGVQGSVSVVNIGSPATQRARTASENTSVAVDNQISGPAYGNQLGDSPAAMRAKARSDAKTSSLSVVEEFDLSAIVAQATSATIGAGAMIDAGGNLTVDADDVTQIKIFAGAAAVGGSIGVGGGVGIANLHRQTNALVGTGVNVRSGGNLTIAADGQILDSDVSGLAGSAGAVGIGAAVAVLTSQNDVSATIGSSSVVDNAGRVSVIANAASDLHTNAAGAALGAAGAIGATSSTAKELGTALATLGNGAKIGQSDRLNDSVVGLTVSTNSNHSVHANTASLAGGFAGSGSANFAMALLDSMSTALIGDDTIVDVSEDVIVEAISTGYTNADAFGINGAAGLSVGGSFAAATVSPEVIASIGDSAQVTVGQNVDVQAVNNSTTETFATSSTGSLVGGTGSTAAATANSNVDVYVAGNAVLTSGGSMSISSVSNNTTDAMASGNAFGVAAGGDVTSSNSITNINSAYANPNSQLTSGDSLSLSAVSNSNARRSEAVGTTGGVVTGALIDANTDVSNQTRVIVGSSARIEADDVLQILAQTSMNADSQSTSDSIAGASLGDSSSSTIVTATTLVDLGSLAELSARMTKIHAKVIRIHASATALFDSAISLGTAAKAEATIAVNSVANMINRGADIFGTDRLELTARHDGVATSSDAQVNAGIVPFVRSVSRNDVNLDSNIDVQAASMLRGQYIFVDAESAALESYLKISNVTSLTITAVEEAIAAAEQVLADAQAGLSLAQNALDAAEADLDAAQSDLSAAQSDLTTAQNAITNLINSTCGGLTGIWFDGCVVGLNVALSPLRAAVGVAQLAVSGVQGVVTVAQGAVDLAASGLVAAQAALDSAQQGLENLENGLDAAFHERIGVANLGRSTRLNGDIVLGNSVESFTINPDGTHSSVRGVLSGQVVGVEFVVNPIHIRDLLAVTSGTLTVPGGYTGNPILQQIEELTELQITNNFNSHLRINDIIAHISGPSVESKLQIQIINNATSDVSLSGKIQNRLGTVSLHSGGDITTDESGIIEAVHVQLSAPNGTLGVNTGNGLKLNLFKGFVDNATTTATVDPTLTAAAGANIHLETILREIRTSLNQTAAEAEFATAQADVAAANAALQIPLDEFNAAQSALTAALANRNAKLNDLNAARRNMLRPAERDLRDAEANLAEAQRQLDGCLFFDVFCREFYQALVDDARRDLLAAEQAFDDAEDDFEPFQLALNEAQSKFNAAQSIFDEAASTLNDAELVFAEANSRRNEAELLLNSFLAPLAMELQVAGDMVDIHALQPQLLVPNFAGPFSGVNEFIDGPFISHNVSGEYVATEVLADTGNVALRLVDGDLVVGAIEALAGSVILEASGGIQNNANTVRGVDVWLTAGSHVGTAENPLDINSSTTANGMVTVEAKDGVYLREMVGDLKIDSVTAKTSTVHLTALWGDISTSGTGAIEAVHVVLNAPHGNLGSDVSHRLKLNLMKGFVDNATTTATIHPTLSATSGGNIYLESNLSEIRTNSELDGNFAEIIAAQADLDAANAELAAAQGAVESAEENLDAAQNLVDDATIEFDAANQNLDEAERDLNIAQNELSRCHPFNFACINFYQQQVVIARSRVDGARIDVSQAKDRLNQAQLDLTHAESDLSVAQSNLTAAESNVSDAELRLSLAESDLSIDPTNLAGIESLELNVAGDLVNVYAPPPQLLVPNRPGPFASVDEFIELPFVPVNVSGNYTVNATVAVSGDAVITIDAGDLYLENASAVGKTTLTATGDITINSTLSSGSDIAISAGDDVLLDTNAMVEIVNGSSPINMIADADADGTGGVLMEAGSQAAASDGPIHLIAGQDIRLGRIVTVGNVSVTSTFGSITGATPNGASLFGTDLQLMAYVGGIGTSANPLNVDTSDGQSLNALAEQSIFITEVDGDLLAESVTSDTGDVTLRVLTGNLTVGTIKAPLGTVTLEASGSIQDNANTVRGVDVWLKAGSGIGTAENPLDIDSSTTVTGMMTAEAEQDVYLNELDGDLNVDSVTTNTGAVQLTAPSGGMSVNNVTIGDGDVMLTTGAGDVILGTVFANQGQVHVDAAGSILDGGADEHQATNIEAQDIVLIAQRRIGTPSQPVEVIATNTLETEAEQEVHVFEVPVLKVESVVINNGSDQRSMVHSLTVTFNSIVTFDESAFILKNSTTRTTILPRVDSFDRNGKTIVTLTFEGEGMIGGSLSDGNYSLMISKDRIFAGEDTRSAPMRMDYIHSFHRMFGDYDGDRDVDARDFREFRKTYRKVAFVDEAFNGAFDFDADGDVDARDFRHFRKRYRTVLNPRGEQ